MRESIYCRVCNSCGEDTCCPPTLCNNDKDGMYCESNINHLKTAYRTLREFYNWLYEDEEANKPVINKLEEIEGKYL